MDLNAVLDWISYSLAGGLLSGTFGLQFLLLHFLFLLSISGHCQSYDCHPLCSQVFLPAISLRSLAALANAGVLLNYHWIQQVIS